MVHIKLIEQVGSFAENKDYAKDIRLQKIIPALEKGQEIILDFEGIDSATQSFIHSLISDLIRKYGTEILDKSNFQAILYFCSK